MTNREKILFHFLKLGIPSPTISLDSYGDLNLQWYIDKENVLTVSINEEGNTHYHCLANGKVINSTDISLIHKELFT